MYNLDMSHLNQRKAIFKWSPCPAFIWEYKGNEFVLKEVNKAAQDLTENSATAFIGLTANEIYPDLPMMISKLEECFRKKAHLEFEHHYKNRNNGTIDWIKFSLIYLEPNYVLLYANAINNEKEQEIETKSNNDRAIRQRIAISSLIAEDSIQNLNLEEGFNKISKMAASVFEVSRASIWMVDANNKYLECQSLYHLDTASYQSSNPLQIQRFPSYFDALELNSILLSNDAQKDPRLAEMQGYLKLNNIQSMLDSTIIIDGKLKGVICLEQIGKQRKWQVDEEAFVSTLASLCTQMILNEQRKKADFEAKKLSENWNLSFNAIKDGIAILDSNHRIIQVNNAFAQYVKSTKEELINSSCYITVHCNTHPHKNCPFVRLKESKARETEIMMIHDRMFELILDPIFDENGQLTGAVHMLNDITEKNRFQKTMEVLVDISKFSYGEGDIRSFLKRVHEQISQILISKNLYVALYSKETETYTFPYHEDEKEFFEGEEAMSLKGSLTDYVRQTGKGQIITEEIEFELRKTKHIQQFGEPSPVWLGAPIINGLSNEVIGVIAVQDYNDKDAYSRNDLEILEIIAHNIGSFIDRIKSMNELKKAKEMAEESDRLKSAFLANMSHEIRTPMNGILGFSELLNEPDLSGDEKKQFIEIIQKSGHRMLDTVNDLIDISKIETGQVKLTLSSVNIYEEINSLYEFFKTETEKKNIQLVLKNHLNLNGHFLKTDRGKLNSILTNLIKNAIKYTNQGKIVLNCEEIDAQFYFSVKDTGIGIPTEKKEIIFNRFEQVDDGHARDFEGFGLGLSITKAYVEMLGGHISLESEYGKGSEFLVRIPV